MHVANFIENTARPPKTGQLSWLLDAGIITAATIAIVATVIPAGLWTHRSQNAAAPAVFNAAGDIDAAEANTAAIGAPLLWRVSNGEATVWLFGTVPSHHRDLGWMDPRLFQAFDASKEVWLDNVPPAPREGDLTAERGASLLLTQRAVRLGKPVTALGRPEPVLASEDVVMTSLWRNGDERALLGRAQSLGSLGGGPDAGRVTQALKDGRSVFVATDITGLIGPGGLVAQLRRDGFKVERLDP